MRYRAVISSILSRGIILSLFLQKATSETPGTTWNSRTLSLERKNHRRATVLRRPSKSSLLLLGADSSQDGSRSLLTIRGGGFGENDGSKTVVSYILLSLGVIHESLRVLAPSGGFQDRQVSRGT